MSEDSKLLLVLSFVGIASLPVYVILLIITYGIVVPTNWIINGTRRLFS